MNIFAHVIRRPVGMSLLALGLTLAGIIAYALLGVAALPSLDLPVVAVYAALPGANAEVMAASVAAPLERHLGQIPGVVETDTQCNDGACSIVLQLVAGRSADKAARDVQQAIDAAQPDLPTLPAPPSYAKADTSATPVLLLSLTSTSMAPDKLYDLADTILKPAVAQLPGVSQVQVFGGTPHAIRVDLDTSALFAVGLTATDVSNALAASNVNLAEGVLSNGTSQLSVSSNAALHTTEDFENLIIATRKGTPIRLADVARVYSGEQDQYQASWLNGERSVTLRISKKADANAIETARDIRERIPALAHWLPADVHISPIFDLTQTTLSALSEVKIALAISVGLVVLVMAVFLRRMGPTAIAMISIPLSLSGAFVVMWVMHYTLNNLSLMALVLCIGFVVDDAIVVIENIVRHMESGVDPMTAAITGTGEIGFTVVSITVSLLAVFVPLLFGNDLRVMILREFSVTLAAAILISAIVSLTLTPALCARYLRHRSPVGSSRVGDAMARFDAGLKSAYVRALDWAMRHRRLMRWQPVLLLVATFGLAFVVLRTAGAGFMPPDDMGLMFGHVTIDANVSPSQLSRRAREVAAIIQADPAVEDVTPILGNTNTGGDVGNEASMFIDLKPLGHGTGERATGIQVVIDRLDRKLSALAGVQVQLRRATFFGSGSSNKAGGQYSFALTSIDGKPLQSSVLRVVQKMRATPPFKDVASPFDQAGQQQRVRIDRDAAARLKMPVSAVDDALYDAFGQRQVSMTYSDLNQYWVVLNAIAAQNLTPGALLATYARTLDGRLLPISTVATISPETTTAQVDHTNQLESAEISYNLEPGTSQQAGRAMAESLVASANLPPGIRMDLTGENKNLQQLQSNAGQLLLASVLAMYIVLGILYESLGHPLTIISTLPAAGAGAFLAMALTHTQLTVMSVIAVLLLIGIVKKNAILMVDFALGAQRERGLSPVEAIREAALVRFRPITMTTLVAIGAALPLAIGVGVGSEMRQPLGIAVVGGLLTSQLLTLLSTPAIYLFEFDRKARQNARRQRRDKRRADAAECRNRISHSRD